jgi:Ser/Thr protein kinase RdoA (MazF antagonist)
VPQPWAGARGTHNDVHPANVIFRAGRAVGLIGFDLAGPGSVAFELAVAACFWIPMLDPRDVADVRTGRTCQRLAIFLDAYGAAGPLRADVVRALPAGTAWIFDIIREAAALGHPAFSLRWQVRKDMARRARAWVRRNQADLFGAVGVPAPQVGLQSGSAR